MKLFGLQIGRQRPEMQGDQFAQTLAQHLVAQAFGEGDLPDTGDYGYNRRDRFIRFTPLARAVNIISSLCAQMLCNGGLTIRDDEDRRVMNRRTDRILELLAHSPDAGLTPAHTFIEDVMAIICSTGTGWSARSRACR